MSFSKDDLIQTAAVINKLIGEQNEDSLYRQAEVLELVQNSSYNEGYAAGMKDACLQMINKSEQSR